VLKYPTITRIQAQTDHEEIGRVPQVRESVPGPKTTGRSPSNALKAVS
jgi:hypothetical protein